MNKSFSRRRFIQTTATAAIATPFILQSCGEKAKLRHACIGVGGMMGLNDLKNFQSHPEVTIVAICDIDAESLKKALEVVPGARTYTDWREMLEKEKENIDSVNVTVPDHSHFAISFAAIEAGKHVYCQKPLCHDVAEVRKLTEAAVKRGVKTQLGTQYASTGNDRNAVKLLKNAAVGKVKHVYLCSNRPGAEQYRLEGPRPAETAEIPEGVNWEVWIGPSPMRPYLPQIYHPVLWRSWIDFGTGWSGDIGCHIFDAVWKGLGLKAPKTIVAEVQQSWAESPERQAGTWPQSNHVTWVFPGNEMTETDELTVEWFDGEFFPPEEIRKLYNGDYPAESAMIIGTEGALLVQHGGNLVLLPEEKFAKYNKPDFKDRNHYHHFADDCLGGERTESHFAQSGPMAEAILLGTVAIRVPGVKLDWDAENLKFPNYPDAEKYLSRKYREGWSIGGF